MDIYLTGDIACEWVKSWMNYVETVDEYNESKERFFSWLDLNGVDDFRNGANAVREWTITSFIPNGQRLARCYRLHVRGRDETTTSSVEGINGVMKRGPLAVTPAMSIATTTKRLIDAANIKGEIRSQNSAKRDQAIPLWTKSPTAGTLTDLAERIVSQNLQCRLLCNAVQGKCYEK
ncbi:MAG: hypothetical protein ACREBR_00115 [bacterium]